MPSLRVYRASDEFARDLAARIGRWLFLALGIVIMLAGLVLAPLPFHIGLPLLVIGLMIVLRSSFKAKRQFLLHSKYLADPTTGLWFHGWTFAGRHHFAKARWARGNSWVTMMLREGS